MKLGLEVFLENHATKYTGKRIGIITNPTGVDQQMRSTVDLLFHHPDLEVTSLFGPEHGIRGDAKEGEKVVFSIDRPTELPVYSLYGKTRKPTQEMLKDVDVLIFDLQDIGSRYYTYIYTLAYVMETCKEFGKELIVLDRPNPISGNRKEGNVVDTSYTSFVGLLPIPNRHGLTVGELALLYKNEYGYDCELTVVEMEGWQRNMYFDDTGLLWVPPSPNTTSIDMCTLYAGTCFIEGTNLSEGRGTTQPFEIIGAPYFDGIAVAKRFNDRKMSGVIARPISFKPTYQKYQDELCYGVQLHVTDRKILSPVRTVITLLSDIAERYPVDFSFTEENQSGKSFFDLLAGNGTLRKQILQGNTDSYFEEAAEQLSAFETISQPYLIY